MVKKQSKRQSLKKKYFIQKKVRDHNRKLRKKERENNKKGIRKRTLRDPGIPNNCPFKKELMDQLEHQREQEALEKELHKERLLQQRKEERGKLNEPTPKQKVERPKASKKQKKARPSFILEIMKVIKQSDVILMPLDARDPLGSRCYAIEEYLKKEAPEKKIVFVLNKIDLIPKENIIEWLRYLTEIHPTVGFKCVFTSKVHSVGQVGLTRGVEPKKKESSVGEDLLRDLLRQLRKDFVKPIMTVGIIGYPNVGKSSLINSLKKSQRAAVGALPGFTKTASRISLEKGIQLLDSPGVIFSKKRDGVDCLLRNLVQIDQIDNTVQMLQDIYQRAQIDRFLTNYRLTKFNTYHEFLKRMGEKKPAYRKMSNAARCVLRDLVVYRFPFYFIPPKTVTTNYRQALQVLQNHEPIFNYLVPVNEDLYLPIKSGTPEERATAQVSLETLYELITEAQTGKKVSQDEDMKDEEKENEGEDGENKDDKDEEDEEDEEDEDEEKGLEENDDDDQEEDNAESFNFATDFVADDD